MNSQKRDHDFKRPDRTLYQHFDNSSDADYALDIPDSDMEPTIPRGSTVLIQRTDTVAEGDIALVIHDGQLLCRRLIGDPFGNIYFVCDNPDSGKESIMVRRDDIKNTICFGRVCKILQP